MSILVTGGAGYIGSHTCVVLLEAGYDVVIIDNASNSQPEVLDKITLITGRSVKYYPIDLLDRDAVLEVFEENSIDAVIHFAGLKAVGESVAHPLTYYHNNLTGTIILCEAMQAHGVHNMVFSSSATVYGANTQVPLTEDLPLAPINPYGRTKHMIEQILADVCHANSDWSAALLRYFNPVGAHESGEIGEAPNGVPNNLVPYVSQVAAGVLKELQVFGDDYPTPDGTGVRDYIHVMDLARGHLKALEFVQSSKGVEAFNLGSGVGHSVLEVIHTFEDVSGVSIPYRIVDRRPGDVAVSYADPTKAKAMLHWESTHTLTDMCRDAWRWERKHRQ